MPALDPNGLTGTPTEYWLWLSPDWSDYTDSSGAADTKGPPGYTHVRMRESRYNNGRVEHQVLDANGDPVADANGPRPPLISTTDAKQQEIFNRQTGDTSVPGMRTYPGVDPSTGQPAMVTEYPNTPNKTYRPLTTAAELAAAGFTPRIEGAYDATTGQYDNEHPVMVVRGPNGTILTQRELTSAELQTWHEDRQRSRNPGNLTDEQVYQRGRQAAADEISRQQNERAAAAAARANVSVRDGPNGLQAIAVDPATGKVTATDIPGTRGKPDQVTVGGAVYERQPDGSYARAHGLPGPPGSLVTIGNDQYWAQPNPDGPPTLTRATSLAGVAPTLPRDNGPQLVAGMSPSQYLQARRGWWLDQRRAGVSQKDIDAGWDQDVQTANALQNEASLQATQQNQRLASSMSGFDSALQNVASIARYGQPGAGLAGPAFEAVLNLQRMQAQRMGGYGSPAPPANAVAAIPPGPAAPAAPSPVFRPPPPITGPLPGPGPTSGRQPGGPAAPAPAAPAPGRDLGPPNIVPPDFPGTTSADPGIGNPPSTFTPPAPASYGDAGDVSLRGGVELPVLFRARINAAPPWKLSEDDYDRARAMGLLDEFARVPSRSSA